MTQNDANTERLPEQAFYELATEKDRPDAELLERIIKKYPRHAEALTELAIELAVDALRGEPMHENEPFDPSDLDPMVSRAMSRFQDRLYRDQQETDHAAAPETKAAAISRPAANPFASLTRTEFRAFSQRIGANSLFAGKVRDRLIDPSTISDGFADHIANNLPEAPEIIVAHLRAQQSAFSASQFNKADNKPNTGGYQSFEDAVGSSSLTPEQQQFLLSL